MSIQGLHKLEVWVRAKDLAIRIYRQVLPLLPVEEKYGMNQQLRRSVQSISANLAEGHGRFYYQDNVRFCYNARGSLEETLSHLVLAYPLNYLPENLFKELEKEGEILNKMINSYITFLKRSKQGANEPGSDYSVREAWEPYSFETDDDLDEQA